MKKVIALILVLSIILTLGCAKPEPAQKEAGEEPVEEAVAEIESELDAIDTLDEDFLATELDELDKELDFEI